MGVPDVMMMVMALFLITSTNAGKNSQLLCHATLKPFRLIVWSNPFLNSIAFNERSIY